MLWRWAVERLGKGLNRFEDDWSVTERWRWVGQMFPQIGVWRFSSEGRCDGVGLQPSNLIIKGEKNGGWGEKRFWLILGNHLVFLYRTRNSMMDCADPWVEWGRRIDLGKVVFLACSFFSVAFTANCCVELTVGQSRRTPTDKWKASMEGLVVKHS